MSLLEGKVAVITGGTRGIGLAIARAYARNGAAVMVASRTQPAVDEAVRQIQAEGGQAAGLAVDVADLGQVQALAESARSRFGRLDIWVNNAGAAGPYGPTLG
ncbi:MAG TPA: SDR family NAD(P)-dependent oxidoreductase, partial [Anaerolineaceae bacterium]|nr:SDR family NAD(P)-dependent oxidoreductase [Anaerolineaceae bacterium]